MYRDIGDYGVIGNPRTAALVAPDGSIDWCCLPDYHSPAVFASLLDDESGGRFSVTLPDGEPRRQRYEPATNVLETTIGSAEGEIRVVDFMPYFMDEGELVVRDELYRRVRCTGGEPTVSVTFDPRFDFARGQTTVGRAGAGYRATDGEETMTLTSTVDLEPADGAATGRFSLEEGEECWFVCRYGDEAPERPDPEAAATVLEWTRGYWKTWSSRCGYDGPWREDVLRSALTLKLLTYEPTGAVVAAATTSLPELPGGTRNWDYRYAWIRDAIFSDWSFYELDYYEFGIEFLDLLRETVDPGCIPPMLDVRGDPVPEERVLDHLDGYRGSRPVRTGNAAATQQQWGTYGALIDGAYFSHRKLGGIEPAAYEQFVRPVVEHVCEVWDEPDNGIWEVRGEGQHFVTSKMWCWVVLDRGVKIATGQGYREDAERWKPVREEIRADVVERGWSEELGAFKISYENEALDASVLLMPLVGFLPADHPKMRRTIGRIQEGLGDGPLVYRYHPEEVESDPIDSGDLAFTTCSFWLVVCLVRLGRTDEARSLFERLLSYANHLGLFAEEVDPDTGTQFGNFPQAYVHMGLVNAAVELDRAAD